jgi:glycosyltransferase involved in cell wall biosynthesis
MKPIAVTVSVNYADFLSIILPQNIHLFKEWIIITDKKDKKTQQLCEYYGVKLIKTDVFYEDGAKFNKWKGINEGLKKIRKKEEEWILFLDSDIVLPPITKRVFDQFTFNPQCL